MKKDNQMNLIIKSILQIPLSFCDEGQKENSDKSDTSFLLELMDSCTPLNPTALNPTQSEKSGDNLILWSDFFFGGWTASLLTSAASSSSLTSPSSPPSCVRGSLLP
jgi:hypothetical protein